MAEYCFMSTETVGLLGTGDQDGHLDFHTASELWVFSSFFCFFGLWNLSDFLYSTVLSSHVLPTFSALVSVVVNIAVKFTAA